MKKLYVINAKGEKEPFSLSKIQKSAQRVGASKKLAREIARTIRKEVYPGIKTADIAKKLKRSLSQENRKFSLKFNLRKGMRKLGPTGFPFEKYIGEIFSTRGFRVKLNQYIPGVCCSYEIDFLALKGGTLYIGECKYRNLPTEKVDSSVTLESYARFLDIKNGPFVRQKKFKDLDIKPIIVTNEKFTSRAIKYSKCVGIELLGWKYPRDEGLEKIIDEYKLYPITVLPSLRGYLINFFVSQRMMLAKDVLSIDITKFTRKTKIPLKYLSPLIREAKILLE